MHYRCVPPSSHSRSRRLPSLILHKTHYVRSRRIPMRQFGSASDLHLCLPELVDDLFGRVPLARHHKASMAGPTASYLNSRPRPVCGATGRITRRRPSCPQRLTRPPLVRIPDRRDVGSFGLSLSPEQPCPMGRVRRQPSPVGPRALGRDPSRIARTRRQLLSKSGGNRSTPWVPSREQWVGLSVSAQSATGEET